MPGNESFEWTQNRLHSLRLRLGWSKSDLARRLHCSCTEIESWEAGGSIPQAIKRELEFISRLADECSDDVKYGPAAESECDRNALSQIDFSRLKADLE